MRRKKIYLDTSAVSYLRQEDAPKEMGQTQAFWEVLRTGRYDVYASAVTVRELSRCAEPKRRELLALLDETGYTYIEVDGNEEILALAAEIASLKIIPAKKVDDRLHIAAAISCGCNIIVSWNFEHMVNVRTIDGVRIVCLANNANPIDIYTPAVLMERSVSNA